MLLSSCNQISLNLFFSRLINFSLEKLMASTCYQAKFNACMVLFDLSAQPQAEIDWYVRKVTLSWDLRVAIRHMNRSECDEHPDVYTLEW